MTIQELKQYVADKRKAKAAEWKKQTAIHGYCRPFTDQDYYSNRDIIFAGKSSYKIKFVHNSIFKTTR
jgi:ethanolamine utilization protein EutP (predicted NTPase)